MHDLCGWEPAPDMIDGLSGIDVHRLDPSVTVHVYRLGWHPRVSTPGLRRSIPSARARCGADVAVTSGKAEACEATAGEIMVETGRKAWVRACRLGRREEIVGAVLYLVSAAASYTTGIALPVAGGEP